jgi:hypothetical protein
VAATGEKENFVDHGLGSQLHGLDPIVLEQEENLLIQSIGPRRHANRIDPP